MSTENGFRFRGFISLLMTLGGLVMIVSGIIAYVMPEGRVAYWTGWRFWGITKDQWNTIHTAVGFVFVLATIFHIAYNWKALLSYLKDKITRTFRMRGELIAALLVTIIVTHGSIAGVAPFTTLMDMGGDLKKSWYAEQDVNPPFPHAELMTLRQLTAKLDLSFDGAVEHLRDKGYAQVSGKTTLKELAAKNSVSPMDIFEEMMMDDRIYR